MILILTDSFDIHSDIVSNKIGNSYFRLNLDIESLKDTKLSFNGEDWEIIQNGKTIISSQVKCVWPRRVSVQMTLEQQQDLSNGFRLWRSEWNKSLFGLYHSLSNATWFNHVRYATLADNKYYQLTVSKKVGLKCPKFITSNVLTDIKAFLKEQPDSVVKFMSQDMYYAENGEVLGLYVNKINATDLEKFSSENENPITVQQYINKKYEVRYTVVGDKHYACAIESQESERAKIDWRRYDVPNTPHREIKICEVIKDKVSALMLEMNLQYGALDFIVDENDDWWFLEINSAGQWLWIEDLTGIDISGSIAKWLTTHSG